MTSLIIWHLKDLNMRKYWIEEHKMRNYLFWSFIVAQDGPDMNHFVDLYFGAIIQLQHPYDLLEHEYLVMWKAIFIEKTSPTYAWMVSLCQHMWTVVRGRSIICVGFSHFDEMWYSSYVPNKKSGVVLETLHGKILQSGAADCQTCDIPTLFLFFFAILLSQHFATFIHTTVLDYSIKKGYTPCWRYIAICIPRDRNYAFYTVRQTLVYGNMQKITENVWRLSKSPVGQISYSSSRGVAIYGGIAHL